MKVSFITARDDLIDDEKEKKKVKRELSPIEKRRRYDRAARQLLKTPQVSKLDYIANLTTNWFISPNLILLFQILVISVYGTFALLAFVLLILYIMDANGSTFDDAIIENSAGIMLIFVCTNILLSIVGCFMTFKIGQAEERGEDLAAIWYGIYGNRSECNDISNFMVSDGKNFLMENDIFMDGQADIKYDLSLCLQRLHRLGQTIYPFADKYNSEELKKVTHYVQMVYQDVYVQFIKVRMSMDRTRCIKLFYKKQLSKDQKTGLNDREFEQLKEQLDAEVDGQDDVHNQVFFKTFPSFLEFDTDLNGNVDILEFETKLNESYLKVLKKISINYRKNKSPEDLAYEKEQREKEKDDNVILMENFKRSSTFGGSRRALL